MKRTIINSSILTLATAGLATTPIGGALGVTHAASRQAATTIKKFKGPVVQMHQWGLLQVSISVKGKKIVAVSAPVNAHTPRSESLQSMALPLLRAETLKAQSASINSISGATDTSDAYMASLTSALKKAHLKTGL